MKASRYCIALIGFMMIACVLCLPGCGQQPAQPAGSSTPEAASPQAVTSVPPAPAPLPPSMREAPAVQQAPVPAAQTPPASAAPAATTSPNQEPDPLARIKACKDLFQLYGLEQKYAKEAEGSEELRTAIAEKWSELEAAKPPQTLTEGLACEDFRMEPAGEGKAKFYFLMKVTKAIPDYHLALIARVDPSHLSQLPKDAQKRGYHVWELFMGRNPTSKWEVDKRYMLAFERDAKPIPYRLSLVLQERNAEGRWVANVGEEITLGWHTPLP